MKDFIQFLVSSIVKNPQNVAVKEFGEGTNFRYVISVDPTDVGWVIGKEGKNINSIRLLAKAKALKEGIWVNVELEDYGRAKTTQDNIEENKPYQADGKKLSSSSNNEQKESIDSDKNFDSDDLQFENA